MLGCEMWGCKVQDVRAGMQDEGIWDAECEIPLSHVGCIGVMR